MSDDFGLVKHYCEYLLHITHIANLVSIDSGLMSHSEAHSEHSPVDISDPSVQYR